MNSKVSTFLLTLIIIISCSCKKKVNSYDDWPKLYVPAYVKATLPYSNGQSVSFSNGAGQVINATVSTNSIFIYTPVCSVCGNPYNRESITYLLSVGSKKFMGFTVTTDTYIQLVVYSPLDNYTMHSGFDFSVESGVSKLSCSAQRQACLSSVTLNGKTFTDVVEITSQGGPSTLIKVYHTVSQGIVGFKYANGTTYNLE